jgi:hypothetical protein
MAVAPVAAIRKQERCVVSGMGGRGEESRAVSISTGESNGAKVQKNATCKVQAVSGEAGETRTFLADYSSYLFWETKREEEYQDHAENEVD